MKKVEPISAQEAKRCITECIGPGWESNLAQIDSQRVAYIAVGNRPEEPNSTVVSALADLLMPPQSED